MNGWLLGPRLRFVDSKLLYISRKLASYVVELAIYSGAIVALVVALLWLLLLSVSSDPFRILKTDHESSGSGSSE